jgi:hypothetical protein
MKEVLIPPESAICKKIVMYATSAGRKEYYYK